MKHSIAIITIVIVAFAFVACTKEQVKEQPKVDTTGPLVSASNDQLTKYPVAGFAYKSAKVSAQQWDKWAKIAAPIVKDVVDKLPEGYVLEIRGHTDGRGPEDPEGNKPGNLKISTDRAKTVMESLSKAGITSSKITVKGVGSSEPLAGTDPKAQEQRRVTFHVVPK